MSKHPPHINIINNLKLAIANAGDQILDSNVFIKAGSFIDAVSDMDNDSIEDGQDNCLHTPNPQQEDFDGDDVGYHCDQTPPLVTCSSLKMPVFSVFIVKHKKIQYQPDEVEKPFGQTENQNITLTRS